MKEPCGRRSIHDLSIEQSRAALVGDQQRQRMPLGRKPLASQALSESRNR
jgi:hypothetical protein